MLGQGESLEARSCAIWIDSIEPRRAKRLTRIFFWTVTFIVGFVQAWSIRFRITEDGNNYLDIASAYLRGDFAHAINAYWSPMFSWLTALVLYVLHPSHYWDSTLLHFLNFAGLLIGLYCFEFCFRAFLKILENQKRSNGDSALSENSWWILGYGLFFSTMLFVISLEPTTPDMWVCVATFLAMGILLRIVLNSQKTIDYALLGLVLGLAYLTKSFYFPLSFVFLLAAVVLAGGWRRAIPRAFVAVLLFALVSGPFMFAISKAKGRFTFGEAGVITYAEFVNPIRDALFWQGGEGGGTPKHPARRILERPAIFEFSTPVGGSYPPTYDMSYWLDGVKPHFNVPGELRILRQSFGTFFLIFLSQSEFAVGLAILLFLQEKPLQALIYLARHWPLWLAPAAGCIAYSLVLVETRYVAPFLPFLWLAAFAGLVNNLPSSSKRFALAVVLGMLAITGVKTAKYFVSDLAVMHRQENEFWQAAQGLHQLGVQPGDKVSIITGMAVAHWARLADVKIVAELPIGQEAAFWQGDRATRATVYAVFARTGSRAVVMKDPPLDAVRDNWQQLGSSSYYARLLP